MQRSEWPRGMFNMPLCRSLPARQSSESTPTTTGNVRFRHRTPKLLHNKMRSRVEITRGARPKSLQDFADIFALSSRFLQYRAHCTEPEKMVCTWFGEIPSCCSLTALLGPVWVLLNYVLQTIFSGPVHIIRREGRR